MANKRHVFAMGQAKSISKVYGVYKWHTYMKQSLLGSLSGLVAPGNVRTLVAILKP